MSAISEIERYLDGLGLQDTIREIQRLSEFSQGLKIRTLEVPNFELAKSMGDVGSLAVQQAKIAELFDTTVQQAEIGAAIGNVAKNAARLAAVADFTHIYKKFQTELNMAGAVPFKEISNSLNQIKFNIPQMINFAIYEELEAIGQTLQSLISNELRSALVQFNEQNNEEIAEESIEEAFAEWTKPDLYEAIKDETNTAFDAIRKKSKERLIQWCNSTLIPESKKITNAVITAYIVAYLLALTNPSEEKQEVNVKIENHQHLEIDNWFQIKIDVENNTTNKDISKESE